MITVNDVTEKVETRQKIELAETCARLTMDAAALGMYELDIVTDELIANNKFNEIFDADHALSRDGYRMLYYPEDRQKKLEVRKDYTLSGAMDYEARIIINGKTKWIRSSEKVLFEDGIPAKVFGSLQDITAQKEFTNE